MAMQITSDTDFQKPSFHLKNSVIALRNLIEKNQVHLIYIPHVPNWYRFDLFVSLFFFFVSLYLKGSYTKDLRDFGSLNMTKQSLRTPSHHSRPAHELVLWNKCGVKHFDQVLIQVVCFDTHPDNRGE